MSATAGGPELAELLTLIDQKKYFDSMPPPEGKTTCLLALAEALNPEGRYRAVYANIEAPRPTEVNVDKGMAIAVDRHCGEGVEREGV